MEEKLREYIDELRVITKRMKADVYSDAVTKAVYDSYMMIADDLEDMLKQEGV
jgi:molecular chaperone GrpE (heat shock protein)